MQCRLNDANTCWRADVAQCTDASLMTSHIAPLVTKSNQPPGRLLVLGRKGGRAAKENETFNSSAASTLAASKCK